MDFATWFQQWLARHPLKEPTRINPTHYTAEVMARVKVEAQPNSVSIVPAIRFIWPWPRLALVAVTTLGAIMIILGLRQESHFQLAQEIAKESKLLAVLGEPLTEPVGPQDTEALAKELEVADTLVLAESPQSDNQWLEQTLQLLEQFDEDAAVGKANNDASPSDEELLNELEKQDQSDFSTTS